MIEHVFYKCKDNDVSLHFLIEDGKIDEVSVKTIEDEEWIVIGFNDLMEGIDKAKQFIEKSNLNPLA